MKITTHIFHQTASPSDPLPSGHDGSSSLVHRNASQFGIRIDRSRWFRSARLPVVPFRALEHQMVSFWTLYDNFWLKKPTCGRSMLTL